MFTNFMPENPLGFVQKPVDMIVNSVGKLGEYGGGVKEGVSRVLRDVVTKILDQGQLGVHRVYDMGLSGTNAVFNLGRKILIPSSRNQQEGSDPNLTLPSPMAYAMQPQASGTVQFQNENQQQRTGQNYPPSNPTNNLQPIVHYGSS